MKLLKVVKMASVMTFASLTVSQAAVEYTVTDLGTWGGNHTNPIDVNSRAEVIGTSRPTPTGSYVPFFWKAGTMSTLTALNGSGVSWYLRINDEGKVVGESPSNYFTSGGAPILHPAVWDIDAGTVTDLSQNTSKFGRISDIASNGKMIGSQVEGTSGVPWQDNKIYVWTQGVPALNTSVGYPNTKVPTAINSFGEIASQASGIAVYVKNGTSYSLGTLGGTQSYVERINDLGQIVGSALTAGDAAQKAYLWNPTVPHFPGGTMKDLGTLGGTNSIAFDVNDFGVVVGYAQIANGTNHAFRYSACGGMQDLNSLIDPLSGWVLRDAVAISNAGHIVGVGNSGRGYLLTPVP